VIDVEPPRKSHKYYQFLKINPNKTEVECNDIFEMLLTRGIQHKYFGRPTYKYCTLEKQFYTYTRYVLGSSKFDKLTSIFNSIGFQFCSEKTISSVTFSGENGFSDDLLRRAKEILSPNTNESKKNEICVVQLDSFAIKPGIQMNGGNLQTTGSVNPQYCEIEKYPFKIIANSSSTLRIQEIGNKQKKKDLKIEIIKLIGFFPKSCKKFTNPVVNISQHC